jgi:hypothetical protein
MEIKSRLKGAVTQSLFRAMLTDAGLSVVPLGIEEVIREVSDLDKESYRSLDLPMQLRTLPDFFVANADRSQSWLVEVKFRKTWNPKVRKELLDTLSRQASHWSPLYLVLFWGETPSKFPELPSSWIKAVKIYWKDDNLWIDTGKSQKLWIESDWRDFQSIQDIFPQLNTRKAWDSKVLNLTIEVAKGLVDL